MRGKLAQTMAFLFVSMTIGGCVGSTSSESGAGDAAGSATVDAGQDAASDQEAGTLTGLVTDDEARALKDVKVSVLKSALVATTDEGGQYTFLNMPIGEYQVFAERLGFESKGAKVVVEVGQETKHNFILVALAVEEMFYETDHYATIMECMVASFVWVSSCTWPYEAVYLTALSQGVNLSQYGAPRDIMDNQFRDTVNVRFGAESTIVSELEWRANTDLAKRMQIVNCAEYDPIEDSCKGFPGDASKDGVSPITHQWELPKDFRPKSADKPTQYISAVWLDWGETDEVGLVLDQKFDLYNHLFFGGEPPEGFTVLVPAP